MTLTTNGASLPLWLADAAMPSFPALAEPTEADACVIGGGIAGLTTAYLLARAGRRVVLLEAFELAAGESGRTTAHWMPPDDRYFEIERSFGAEGAVKVARSFRAAADLAQSIVRDEGIACGFERLDGYLYCLPGQDPSLLDKELAAARRAGVDVERVDAVPGLPFDTGDALRFASQAQFHPVQYLAGLARACADLGVRIHCGSRALAVEGEGGRLRVDTEVAQVHADAVVVATNTPFIDRVVMHTKQAGYRTYVLALAVPRGTVPNLLLWDAGDPYQYVRLATPRPGHGHDILVVGGADHKVGQPPQEGDPYQRLESWTRQRFPMAGAVLYRWSGQVMEPADGQAFFGPDPLGSDGVYLITGDSGTGMTHCTAGAMAVADMICGRPNDWCDLYAPSRKAVHGLGEFVKEQANTLAQYKGLVTGGDVDDVDRIEPGQGAVVRRGAHKLAVYRDEGGALHARSAICTHLGCVVAWNPAEKSWDCPCHGSRFGVDGQVLHGPAGRPLGEGQVPER